MIEIRHRFSGDVIQVIDADSLQGAYLGAIDLRRADLSGADLSGAYLGGADLRWADLSGANLSRADLSEADLSEANLRGADLRGANLSGADLRGVDLRRAKGMAGIVVPNLHTRIAEAVGRCGEFLQMDAWHTCKTTHCRGGHAISLAGKEGAELEGKVGSQEAAALIYLATYPDEPVPDFWASKESAMADILACAEREKAS
jgi:uncharacterized protein YjbI with pentapeptide repeats